SRLLPLFEPHVRRARAGPAEAERQGRRDQKPDARGRARSTERADETSARSAESREVMRRPLTLAALLTAGVLSIAASAFQRAARGDEKVVTLQKIRDNVYLSSGGGGNSAVFVTDLGVVIVDTKLPGWGQPLLAKIRTM